MKQPFISVENRKLSDIGRVATVVSTDFTILDDDKITYVSFSCNTVNRILNLPNPVNNKNRVIYVTKADGANYDAGYLHIKTPLSGSVEGFESMTMYGTQSLSFISNGLVWLLMSGGSTLAKHIGYNPGAWQVINTTATYGTGVMLKLYPGEYWGTTKIYSYHATYSPPTGGAWVDDFTVRASGSAIMTHYMQIPADYNGTNQGSQHMCQFTTNIANGTSHDIDFTYGSYAAGSGTSSYLCWPNGMEARFYRGRYV